MASNEPIYRHWSAQYPIDLQRKAYKWRREEAKGERLKEDRWALYGEKGRVVEKELMVREREMMRWEKGKGTKQTGHQTGLH